MQSTTLEQLSATDAQVILEHLPERIRAALIARAADIEYPQDLRRLSIYGVLQGQPQGDCPYIWICCVSPDPIEAVVEMAIASFLDGEALGAC